MSTVDLWGESFTSANSGGETILKRRLVYLASQVTTTYHISRQQRTGQHQQPRYRTRRVSIAGNRSTTMQLDDSVVFSPHLV